MRGQLVLFAVAVFVALTSFGIQGTESHLQSYAPKPKCCFPKQWSAYLNVLASLNTETPTVLDVQIDYCRKQQAVLNYTGSKTPVSKAVIDYDKRMLYFIPANDTKCYKTPFMMPMIECIPADAEYLGDSYLGPMGAGQLAYDVWRIRAKAEEFQVVSTLAMTKKECVPLVQGESFPQYPSQNQLYMFSGFRPGLTDPSVFQLPDSCFK